MNKMAILDKFKEALVEQGDEAFFDLLALPESQFKVAYDELYELLDMAAESEEYRESIRQAVVTKGNLDSEVFNLEEIIKEIDEEDTLSIEKKNFLKKVFGISLSVIKEYIENPSQKIKVQVKTIHENATLPQYANKGDAGMDIYAIADTTINGGETVIVPTGLTVAIPIGYEIQIRSRSGMAAKTPLRIANGVGTIDSQYRGEIGVIFDNISNEPYEIRKGDRIAQMVLNEVPSIKWVEVEELGVTERGFGYGSSGK